MNYKTITTCLGVAAAVSIAALPLQAELSAEDAYKKNCAACHGKDGKGDTKAGKKAGAKDLTDAEYQKSFTDEDIFKSIKEGMKVDGEEKMKPFASKLTDQEIKSLIPYVRQLKK